MSNIGRAIVKKLAVKFEGNEIMSIDDFDVFACYRDLWQTKSEKRNATQQGIISTHGCTENCIKLRINSGDKSTGNAQDNAIANTYESKCIIPLDFEMLDSDGCMENCIKLRINAGDKTLPMPKIRLLQMPMETNS